MGRTDCLEKTLFLGRQEEKGITEDEMIGWYHRLQWTWILASSRSWWWAGKPGMLQSMGSKIVRTTEWLNWTESVEYNSLVKLYGFAVFFIGRFLFNNWFKFFELGPIHIVCVWNFVVCIFQGAGLFHQNYQICGHRLVHNILLLSFY